MAGNRKLTLEVLGDASGGLRALNQIDNGAKSAFDNLEKQGKRMALALGGGAIAAGVAIFKIGSEYRSALNEFEAVSGATTEQMEKVRSTAKALGADMTLPATSAGGAAKAMTELAKAGLSVEQSMTAAKGTLTLAAAAQISEGSAAEIAANALNSFHLSAEKAGMVVDTLANVANASSVGINDVAQASAQASAVWSTMQGAVMGNEAAFKSMNVQIGLLGNVGLKGSDAGTSLKQSLLALAKPSAKSKDLMRALMIETSSYNDTISVTLDKHTKYEGSTSGLLEKLGSLTSKQRAAAIAAMEASGAIQKGGDIAYDATGKMRSYDDIIANVAAGTKGMTEEQRNFYVAQIFGTDASRAVLALMSQTEAQTTSMTAALSRQGSGAELATAMTKGLGGALGGLKSQLETIAIDIYERVEPALDKFVRQLADKLPAAFEAVKGAIATFIDKLKPVGEWMAANTGTVKVFLAVLAGAAAIAGVLALAAAFASLFNPISVAILAIAGIAAGVKYAYEHFEGFRKVVDSVVAFLRTTFTATINTVRDLWKRWGDEITSVAKAAFDQVKTAIQTAMGVIQGIIKTVTSALRGDWSGVWNGLKQIASSAMDGIIATIRNAGTILGAAAKAAFAAIETGARSVWASLKAWVSSLPGSIKAALGNAASILFSIGKQIVQGLVNGMMSMIGPLTSAVNKIAAIPSKVVSLVNKVLSPSRVMHEIGEYISEGYANGILAGEKYVRQASQAVAVTAARVIGGDRAIELASRAGSDVGGAFADGLAASIPDIVEQATTATEAAMTALAPVLNWTADQAASGQFARGTDANGNTIEGNPFAANPDGSTMLDANGKPIFATDTAGIAAASARQFGTSSSTSVTVNVQGSVISERDLVDTVRTGLVQGQTQGYGLVI